MNFYSIIPSHIAGVSVLEQSIRVHLCDSLGKTNGHTITDVKGWFVPNQRCDQNIKATT